MLKPFDSPVRRTGTRAGGAHLGPRQAGKVGVELQGRQSALAACRSGYVLVPFANVGGGGWRTG